MSPENGVVVTWRLTLEPAGFDVAWSLLRASGDAPAVAVDGGLFEDAHHLAAVAESVRPRPVGDGQSTRWDSDLLDPALEASAAHLFGQRLLPEAVRSAVLQDRCVEDPRHEIEIAARGWVATLPWDAFAVDDDLTRLAEVVVVRSAMSPGVIAQRARTTEWGDADDPGLAIIDPGPASGHLGSIFAGESERYPALLWGPNGLAVNDLVAPGAHPMSRNDAAELLAQGGWSRLLYLGHVQAPDPDSPADAALVFERQGRPDLLSAARWLAWPERWPAPARVALIACGSDDAAYLETSGLPAAAVNAGARLVTTTRWPLPADRHDGSARGTTELMLAVHRAHRQSAPVRALRTWQVEQLERWRTRPSFESSPLLWAALSTYAVPGETR